MNNTFNLKNIEAHFKDVLLYAPKMLGNDAVNFFLDRFQQQNWLDVYPEPWQRRKINNRKNQVRLILIQTGALRRSIRITNIGTGFVTIGSDLPYAKAHNEGFEGIVNVKEYTRNHYTKQRINTGKLTKSGKERMKTVHRISGSGVVRAHTMRINIPKRQFMGESQVLTQQLTRRLTAELMKGLR